MSGKFFASAALVAIVGLFLVSVSTQKAFAEDTPGLPPEAAILDQLDEAEALEAEGRNEEALQILDAISQVAESQVSQFEAHPPRDPEFLAERRPPAHRGDRPRGPQFEEMRAMWKKMKELKEQGKEEEAAELRQKMREKGREMFRAAMAARADDPKAQERRELGKKMREQYRKMRELREAGNNEEAEQVQKELREMRKKMASLLPEGMKERMKHMRHHGPGRHGGAHHGPGHRMPEKLRAELRQTHQKIQALMKEGKTEEAKQVRREMGEKMRKHMAAQFASRGDRPGPPHWKHGGPHRDHGKSDRDRHGPGKCDKGKCEVCKRGGKSWGDHGKHHHARHGGPHGPKGDGPRHCPFCSRETKGKAAFGRMHGGPGGPHHHRPPFQFGSAAGRVGGSPQMQKLQHLRMAAVHLQQAGYEEHAKKAREEAGRLQQKLGDRPGPRSGGDAGELRAKIQRLEHHVRNLHRELQKLKKYHKGDDDEDDDDD